MFYKLDIRALRALGGRNRIDAESEHNVRSSIKPYNIMFTSLLSIRGPEKKRYSLSEREV